MDLAGFGEELAARFLTARGASIVARNVQVGRGEIDLIAVIDGIRVAVEVKTRRTGDAAAALDRRKLQAIRSSIRRLHPPVHRLDLVTVELSPDGVDVGWRPEIR